MGRARGGLNLDVQTSHKIFLGVSAPCPRRRSFLFFILMFIMEDTQYSDSDSSSSASKSLSASSLSRQRQFRPARVMPDSDSNSSSADAAPSAGMCVLSAPIFPCHLLTRAHTNTNTFYDSASASAPTFVHEFNARFRQVNQANMATPKPKAKAKAKPKAKSRSNRGRLGASASRQFKPKPKTKSSRSARKSNLSTARARTKTKKRAPVQASPCR